MSIKGKEYSVEELEKMLEAKATPPKPAPEPPKPAPEPPKPDEAAIQKAENDFIAQVAPTVKVDLTPQEMDAVLAGGEEGIKALNSVLQRVAARSILETRKMLHPELSKAFENLQSAIQPLVQQDTEMRKYSTEQACLTKYPEFKSNIETARLVGETLLSNYPEEVAKMTPDQFIELVAQQTDAMLSTEFKRWNPSYAGTWKDWAKAQAVVGAVTPEAPAAAATSPTASPEPPKPAAKPAIQPPAGNSPTIGIPMSKSFHKSVAASLVD